MGRVERAMARICLRCPLCVSARSGRGLALWLVKHVESKLCPFCRAYERVYGRKAYEPAELSGRLSDP